MQHNKKNRTAAISLFIILFLAIVQTVSASREQSIHFYSSDATKLTGKLFLPDDTHGQKLPAILFINSWMMDKNEYVVQAKKFADEGYIVLSYNARGWGDSGGYVNCAGNADMSDLRAALDWLKNNTPIDHDRIGAAGISYGAGISLVGLAHFPEIRTVVAMSGWSDLFEAFYSQNTPRAVWGGILLTTGYLTGRMDPEIKKLYEDMLKNKNIDHLKSWARERSAINYLDVINARSVPTSVYISQNLEDELFQPNAVVSFYEKLTVKKHLELNQGIHATAELGGLLGLSNHVWQNVHAWMAQELKSKSSSFIATPGVSMQVKFKNTREELSELPSSRIHDQAFYLNGRKHFLTKGELSGTFKESSSTDTINSGLISGMVTGIPLIGPLFEAHINIPILTWLPGTNHLESVYYQSSKQRGVTKLRGIPKVKLDVKPTSSKMQLVAYLYDVDALGTGKLITHGVATLHDANKNHWQTLDFELIETAYDVPKGHRIAVGFDTHDTPYGAPTIMPYKVSIRHNSASQSMLTLPVLS